MNGVVAQMVGRYKAMSDRYDAMAGQCRGREPSLMEWERLNGLDSEMLSLEERIRGMVEVDEQRRTVLAAWRPSGGTVNSR